MNDNFSNSNVPNSNNEALAREAVNLIQQSSSSERVDSSAQLTFLGKGAFTYAFRVVGKPQAVIKATQRDSFSKFANFQRKAAGELAKAITNYPNISFKVPNIEIIKKEEIAGQDYIIYQEDFACGKALGQLTDGELTADDLLNVFRGLAQLLEKCAEAGFSYCDFKPLEHIYIEKGTANKISVTLIDWGNATSLKDKMDGAYQDIFQFYRELPSAFDKIARFSETAKQHPVQVAGQRVYPAVVLRYSLPPFPYLPSWTKNQNVYRFNLSGRATDKISYVKNLWQLIQSSASGVPQDSNGATFYSNWIRNKDFISYLALSVHLLSAFDKEVEQVDKLAQAIQSSTVPDETTALKLIDTIEQEFQEASRTTAHPEIKWVYDHARLKEFFGRLKADLKVYIALQRSSLVPNKQDRLKHLDALKTTFETHFYFAQEYKNLATEVQSETERQNAKDTFLAAVKARNFADATQAFAKLDTEEQNNNRKWLANLQTYSQTYEKIQTLLDAYTPDQLKEILQNFSSLAELEFPEIAKDEKFQTIATAFSTKDAGFEQWLENARRSDSNVETKIELLRKGKEQGFQTSARYGELEGEVKQAYQVALEQCKAQPSQERLTPLRAYASSSVYNPQEIAELENKIKAIEGEKEEFKQALGACQNWDDYLKLIKENKPRWQEHQTQIEEKAKAILQASLKDSAQWDVLSDIQAKIQATPESEIPEAVFSNLPQTMRGYLAQINNFRALQLLAEKQAVLNNAIFGQFPPEFGTEFSSEAQAQYKNAYGTLADLREKQFQNMPLAGQTEAKNSGFEAEETSLNQTVQGKLQTVEDKLNTQSILQWVQLAILLVTLLFILVGLAWRALSGSALLGQSRITPTPTQTQPPSLTPASTSTSSRTPAPSKTPIPTPEYVPLSLAVTTGSNLFMSPDCSDKPILRFTGAGDIEVETKNIGGDMPPGRCIAVQFEIQVSTATNITESTCILSASNFTIQSKESNSSPVTGEILEPDSIPTAKCTANENQEGYSVLIDGYLLRTEEQQP